MVDVKFLAQRVAELMRGKVLVAAKAGQAVVREGTGPHDLAHGRLVVRVLHGGGAVAEDDAQQRLGQLVGQIVVGDGVKIAVHGVHQDVAHAAGDLMVRQRRGQHGIENGEDGPVEVGVEPALLAGLGVRQHGGIARLAARGRDGQHHADRHGARQHRALFPELPQVRLRVGRAVRDGLAGVDDAAAADGQNELRAERKRQLHALAGQRHARVRLHAAERLVADARFLQQLEHAVKQSALSRARAAVDDEHARKLPLLQQLRQLADAACAEYDLGGYVILKCMHGLSRDAVCLDYAFPFCDLLGQRFERAAEIAGLGRNGDHGAAAGGDRLVDGQYIRAAVGKNS